MYKDEWYRLVGAREAIAHYSPVQAIKSMKGIAKEKFHAMEHHYPARMAWIEKIWLRSETTTSLAPSQ